MATHFQPRGPRPAERAPREDTPILNVDDIRFGEKPDPRLFAEIAEEKAADVARGGGRETNKSSQLRRFYDELVMWQEKVGASDERFAELQPYICMLKAKVAYTKGRGHVDANFEALLRHVIDQCTNAATLRQAKLFLEAFMAFYKVHNK
jgi:CRISPR-associated protein Csm2